MAKTKVARKAPTKEAQPAPLDPHRFDPARIALSKAYAAWWLLDELAHGELLEGSKTNTSPQARDGEVRDWLLHVASETLHDAIDEAEAAYRESREGKPPVAA
jgi:hypothetical protein